MAPSFDVFRKWNERLTGHFFNKQAAGQEVLLFVTSGLLDEIGADLGGATGFLAAMTARPPAHGTWGLCRLALKLNNKWRDNPIGISQPPCVAYLALFVLAAAEQNADLNANAYHPHLARLLQVAQAGPLPSFDQMEKLWQDLAWWANERQHELLGRFTFRRRGHLTHVGLPRAQTLLSRDERQALPDFFELAELYPGEQVPDARFTQLLLRHGGPWLQARTRRLLQTAAGGPLDDQLLRTALLELIQDELLRWDGQLGILDLPDSTAPRPQPVRAGLRLFVRDHGLGRLAVRLRFRATRELPDAELHLCHGPLHLTCYGLPGGGGWTAELAHPDGAAYDAAAHDWQKPLALHDGVRNYTARLRGGAVRLLLPAERHGLPRGWLEAEALEDDGAFRLLVHASRWETVRAWGEACCGQFRAVAGATVPAGWQWAEGRHPRQSCPGVAALALPERATARLVGGLRTDSRSNEFLRFALPRLVVRGTPAGVAGFVNGQPLAPLENEETGFVLPTDLAAGPSHWLEVRQGEQVLLRRTMRVSEGYRTVAPEAFGRDPTGSSVEATERRAAGAFLQGSAIANPDDAAFPRPLPTQLARTLILLGERPGQVAEWPAEPAPTTWHPVWAVGKVGRDRWEPFFCGTAAHLLAGRPGPPLAAGSRRKAWRKATHTERNHTTVPKMKALAQLWKTYQDAGKNL